MHISGVGVDTDLSRTETAKKTRRLLSSGLHFCRYYENLVRFDPEFCDKCPHNGLRPQTKDTD